LPRPPIQHHKLIISFDREARELIEDVQETWIKAKAVGAAGEAAEGVLSNPNLAFLVGGGVLAALGAYVGKDAIDNITKYFGSLGTMTSPDATQEDKVVAANNAARQLREILKSVPVFGSLVP